jgi:hypothetical protein
VGDRVLAGDGPPGGGVSRRKKAVTDRAINQAGHLADGTAPEGDSDAALAWSAARQLVGQEGNALAAVKEAECRARGLLVERFADLNRLWVALVQCWGGQLAEANVWEMIDGFRPLRSEG